MKADNDRTASDTQSNTTPALPPPSTDSLSEEQRINAARIAAEGPGLWEGLSRKPILPPLLSPPSPQPDSPTPATPKPPPPRRSHSRIAELPSPIRKFINESLRDGLTYANIAAQLDAKGYPNITIERISAWFRSAYQLWLDQLRAADSLQARCDASSLILQQFRQNADSVHQFARLQLQSHFADTIANFDPQLLRFTLAHNPELIFRIADSLKQDALVNLQANALNLKRQAPTPKARKFDPDKPIVFPRSLLQAFEKQAHIMP